MANFAWKTGNRFDSRFWLLAGSFFLFFAAQNAVAQSQPISPRELAFFESKVRPILVENCYACHSVEADAAEGGLRLDSAVAMRSGGKSGPVIVRGNPERSLLMLSVRHQKPAIAMPPEDVADRLSDDEIGSLEKWIRMGAPDPREQSADDALSSPSKNYASLETWWAYQPLKIVPLPNVDRDWAKNPIDRWVRKAQQVTGTEPAGDADPRTLLRRVYYDVTGLPPTPEQSASFLKAVNASGFDAAYEQLVDELLASDQFGLHWGRHWLDVARYSESSGREFNSKYPHAWRYRNWVIEAMNSDLPYDQFLIEQIAGDLLTASEPAKAAANTIATGFLAIGSKSLNEMNPRQFAVDQADEQIDAVFQATMGLTMACARCHDHKFDPISQRDYTAVAGIFLSTKTFYGTISRNQNTRNVSSLIPLPQDSGEAVILRNITPDQYATRREKLAKQQIELQDLQRQALMSRKAGDDKLQNLVRDLNRLRSETMRLETELAEYEADGRVVPLAMGVEDLPARSNQGRLVAAVRERAGRELFDSVTDSPFFARGEISLAGDKVPRSVPDLFGNASQFEIPRSGSGRLQLAKWIVDPSNPMTARVAVNRIWGWLLGDALVDSVDNFGTSGLQPSHPELLDYLADDFIKSGWQQKALIKKILLSHTYRLAYADITVSNAVDPSNTTFWRANLKRLPAEAIRDSMLLAAGSLDASIQLGSELARSGEGPVRPQAATQFRENVMNKRGAAANPIAMLSRSFLGREENYRSIFLANPRDERPEIFELFDGADGTVVQGKRDVTNVPSQSLFMLNSPEVHAYSLRVAENAIKAAGGPSKQSKIVDEIFARVLCRPASSEDFKRATVMLEELRGDPTQGYASLAKALFATSEFRYLD